MPIYLSNINNLAENSDQKVKVVCELNISEECEKIIEKEYKDILINSKKNDGKYVCFSCSKLKNLNEINSGLEYNLDDNYFEKIDHSEKAYILGYIDENNITEKGFVITVSEGDLHFLGKIRNLICNNLPIIKSTLGLMNLKIYSEKMANDLCKHLKIKFAKFPDLDNDKLKWDFIRGCFDANGFVCLKENENGTEIPFCCITHFSQDILESIKKFCHIPYYSGENKIEWYGVNAIDFLNKLYNNATLYLDRKYDKYNELRNWKPGITRKLPKIKYTLTCDDIYKPQKNRESDAGYDLHLIKKIKEENGVYYYDTCVKIQPDYGYYCELVGRSSITKTGYMLANNIGILDPNYSGSIIVALVKINPNAQELNLPIKLVQLIPREYITVDMIKVNELDKTTRNDEGGLGSKNIK